MTDWMGRTHISATEANKAIAAAVEATRKERAAEIARLHEWVVRVEADRDHYERYWREAQAVADSKFVAVETGSIKSLKGEIEHLRSAIDYTKAILETQDWWHDPSHDLYPLRLVLEDATKEQPKADCTL